MPEHDCKYYLDPDGYCVICFPDVRCDSPQKIIVQDGKK